MSTCITIPEQTVSIPSQEVCFTVNAPTIVYQNSWLNQTAAINEVNFFSVPSDGLYRLTLGGKFISNAGTGDCVVEFRCIRNNFGTSASVGVGTNGDTTSGPFPTSANSVFFGLNGDMFTFSVSISGVVSRVNFFNAYITIEQIQ